LDKKTLILSGIVFCVINAAINLGIFVTFKDMQAYAVSKDSFQIVLQKINTMDQKIDDIKNILIERKDK
jgi:hypothetical protein